MAELEGYEIIALVIISSSVVFASSISLVFFVVYSRKKILEKELERLKADEEHQKEKSTIMNKVTIESRELEKSEISRFLHDDINMRLSHVEQMLYKFIDDHFEEIPKAFDAQLAIINETRNELRNLSHQLVPSALKLGLEIGLSNLVRTTQDSSGIEIILEVDSTLEQIHSEKGKIIFRICQELLQNALKHSACTRVAIDLFPDGSDLCLIYFDNGIGKKDSDIYGNGFINFEAYSQYLNGSFRSQNLKNGGFELSFTFPMNQFYEKN